MADPGRVVVVGGGVTGLSLALELVRMGARPPVVLERSYTGAGASGRNVGRVRSMQLTPELTRFAVEAQRKHLRLADELGHNTLLWRAGYAWVLYETDEVERIAGVFPMLARHGVRPRLLDRRRTLRAVPILSGGEPPVGAVLNADYVVHHDAVVHALRKSCLRAGVTLREGTAATGLRIEGGGVAGVTTDAGEVPADIVVNAAEAWSAQVSGWAGVSVPSTTVRREVLVTEPARPFTSPAVTFYRPTEGWFNQTLRGELVAGVVDPEEPAGLNHGSTFGFLRRAAATLVRKAPGLGRLRVIRQWGGVYEMTPDRMPLAGPVAEVDGFWQANGYSGRGFAFAPLVAELLASWITRGRRPELLAPFDANRFAGRTEPVLSADYYAGYRASGGDGRG